MCAGFCPAGRRILSEANHLKMREEDNPVRPDMIQAFGDEDEQEEQIGEGIEE